MKLRKQLTELGRFGHTVGHDALLDLNAGAGDDGCRSEDYETRLTPRNMA
jgi:hypothetical protein